MYVEIYTHIYPIILYHSLFRNVKLLNLLKIKIIMPVNVHFFKVKPEKRRINQFSGKVALSVNFFTAIHRGGGTQGSSAKTR